MVYNNFTNMVAKINIIMPPTTIGILILCPIMGMGFVVESPGTLYSISILFITLLADAAVLASRRYRCHSIKTTRMPPVYCANMAHLQSDIIEFDNM